MLCLRRELDRMLKRVLNFNINLHLNCTETAQRREFRCSRQANLPLMTPELPYRLTFQKYLNSCLH